jgi:hypothetical protein
MQRRERERRPRRADLRAANWVINTTRESLRDDRGSTHSGREPLHTAYTVNRQVKTSTPGGIFDRDDMRKIIDGDHGARVFPNFLATLVNPRQSKEIATAWEGTQGELHAAFETAADTLPTTRSGFLLHAIIVGARKDRSGPRYPSFIVDRSLQSIMREERTRLLAQTGQPYLDNRTYTPHITMFETADRECAQDLRDQMEGLLVVERIPVELGKVNVVPIANTRRPVN